MGAPGLLHYCSHPDKLGKILNWEISENSVYNRLLQQNRFHDKNTTENGFKWTVLTVPILFIATEK